MPGPGVPFPPPILFIAGFALSMLLHRMAPLTLGRPDSLVRELVGAALIVGGLLWMAWGLITFFRARTAIYPRSAATRLVAWGPYRFGRNPMYLGLSLAYAGSAFVLNLVWPLVLLPLVIVALVALVVRREERHLEETFGEDYAAYRRRVRRWL